MQNDQEQVEKTGIPSSFDHESVNKVVSHVSARVSTAKSFLVIAVITNMAIAFIVERSVWTAAASLIAAVAGVMAFAKITDAADRACTAIALLLGLTTNTIQETIDLQARAKKTDTALQGKVSTNATTGVDADGTHFLRFDIAIDNVDCDRVINAIYPCGVIVADILKTRLRTGARVSINGNFVGRIQSDDPARRLCIEYVVSSLNIL